MIVSIRALTVAFALALLATCGPESTLHRVGFRVRVGGVERDAREPLRVRTPSGWDVTLTAAEVSIGPIYFRNAPPSAGTTDPQGRAVAQVLARFPVDALDPSLVELPEGGNGIDEPARSAEIRLAELTSGPVADAAGGAPAIAHVAGSAVRDGVTIVFDGVLALPMDGTQSDYDWVRSHRVEDIPVEFRAADGGTLTLRVDPTHWLDAVDFESLPESGGVRRFTGRAPTVQLLNHVGASVGVYRFTFEAPQ